MGRHSTCANRYTCRYGGGPEAARRLFLSLRRGSGGGDGGGTAGGGITATALGAGLRAIGVAATDADAAALVGGGGAGAVVTYAALAAALGAPEAPGGSVPGARPQGRGGVPRRSESPPTVGASGGGGGQHDRIGGDGGVRGRIAGPGDDDGGDGGMLSRIGDGGALTALRGRVATSGAAPRSLWLRVDAARRGHLTAAGLAAGLRRAGVPVTAADAEAAVAPGGALDYAGFVAALYGPDYGAAPPHPQAPHPPPPPPRARLPVPAPSPAPAPVSGGAAEAASVASSTDNGERPAGAVSVPKGGLADNGKRHYDAGAGAPHVTPGAGAAADVYGVAVPPAATDGGDGAATAAVVRRVGDALRARLGGGCVRARGATLVVRVQWRLAHQTYPHARVQWRLAPRVPRAGRGRRRRRRRARTG